MRLNVSAATLSLLVASCGDDAAFAVDAAADAGRVEDAGEVAGDGAPGGVDAGEDSGAANGDGGARPEPTCGNGVLNTDEICEGFELREATCESEGFSAGRLRCSSTCALDTSECSSCGDGEITGPEVCEPGDLAGATCAGELGAGYGGQLECAPDCTSVVTAGCRPEIPAQSLRSCDPTAAAPCSDPAASCVQAESGNFCFETCDTTDRAACGVDRFCYDYEGQGVCLDVPANGEVCTTRSGCSEDRNLCIPAFDYEDSNEISICAVPCQASMIGTGTGCEAGQACVPVPGGQVELQSQTPCASDSTCDQTAGYRCLPTSEDDPTSRLCARPVAICASPVPFFAFDGGSTLDSVCDREYPSQGLKLCGIAENASGNPGPMATAVCRPLRAQGDRLGVCVGFCDSEILNTVTDGFCGDGFTCAVPSEPEFFLAASETDPLVCDPAAPRCTVEEPECLDIGRGPECARPAKVCIPL